MIDVWTDPWLPRTYSFKVLSQPRVVDTVVPQIRKVSELIDENTHSWKADLVKELFVATDVDSILSIPVSTQGVLDRGLWHFTANGAFTVRSAYYVAKSLNYCRRSTERGETSSTSPCNSGWKDVWKIPASNKVRHFIWRCLHNAIANFANLQGRHLDINPLCPKCHKEHETI